MAQSIFIPKVGGASDLAALDYFVWEDAVYPADTNCSANILNKHGLVNFPKASSPSNSVYFPGVMGQDYGGAFITVELFWVAPAVVGDVVWFVSWERDEPIPFGAADLNVDSYAPEKSIVSAAPPISGRIRKAVLLFTAAEADGILSGDPYRLRIRRDGGVLLDTMAGVAQLFRVSLEGVP